MKTSKMFTGLVLLDSQKRGSRAISKPAPNPGAHQIPVETLSDGDIGDLAHLRKNQGRNFPEWILVKKFP